MLKLILLLISSCTLLTACIDTAATGGSIAYDRYNTSQRYTDRSISFNVQGNLFEHPSVYDHSNFSITTFRGQVLLAGEVPTEAIRTKAAYLASTVGGVTKVYNFLTIGPEISLWQKTRDSWITTKIKTQFLTSKDINPMEIKITTENGVVYLLGQVTDAQGELATKLARTTQSVKKVVLIFNYVTLSQHPANKKT